MKTLLSFTILIIILFSYNITNAAEWSSYSLEANYKLYQERVKNICEQYKPEKFLINIEDNYLIIEDNNIYSLANIKNTHRTNMNNIYKCSLLKIQKKSLLLIKIDLIKKNAELSKKLAKKIDIKVMQIELTMSNLKCINSEEKTSIQKLNVLKQTTYQTCKYINYLEYLRENNQKINSLIEWSKEKYDIRSITKKAKEKINELDKEIKHTYRIFPLAFHAYTEYENNITIHFLLELIKEDYVILRQKLHNTLNPINQLVYKVSNAMYKP